MSFGAAVAILDLELPWQRFQLVVQYDEAAVRELWALLLCTLLLGLPVTG
jgi:hypothetical protein